LGLVSVLKSGATFSRFADPELHDCDSAVRKKTAECKKKNLQEAKSPACWQAGPGRQNFYSLFKTGYLADLDEENVHSCWRASATFAWAAHSIRGTKTCVENERLARCI